jgi:HD superfamily phosphohydrolase
MEKIHELVTEAIIKNDDDLEKILSGEQREAIIELLHKGGRKDFKSDIVSGPLDADKLDYLLRDNYHTGVKYGLFDLDKIIESLRVIEFGVEETYLGISEEGIYALEQFIMAKYHMTTQVYFHRIRGITDCMIIRGIETAVDEGLDEVKYIYQYDGTKDFMKRYCEYNDGNLTELIRKKGGKLSSEIFDRLYNRRLLKLIHNRRLSDISGIKLKDRYTNFEATDKKELEKSIAEKMKVDPALVIINIFDIISLFRRICGRFFDRGTT